MDKNELNRRIAKLYSKTIELRGSNIRLYFDFIEQEGKEEFIELHHADKSGQLLTLSSLKMMIILNRQHRFIPQHIFYYDLKV